MAITYVNVGTALDTASGSPTLTYPAGIANGDLLIVCGHKRATANTPAAPSSTLTWTEQIALSNHTKIWTAIYDGSATAPTVATGGQSMYAVMLAVRGIDPASMVDAVASLDNGSHSAMHYPGLTIANDNEFILTYCRNVGSNSGVTPTLTEIVDSQPTSGGTSSVHIQYTIQTSKSNLAASDLTTSGGSAAGQFGLSISINALASGSVVIGRPMAGGFQSLSGNV